MPGRHARYIDPDTLRAVWLEEGDGVAILADSEPLAVIPGWSDLAKGMPGLQS